MRVGPRVVAGSTASQVVASSCQQCSMEQLRAWVGHPDAPGASAARVLGWALASFLGFVGARRFGAPLCFPRSHSLRPTDCNYFAISVVNIVHAVVMGAASVSMIVGDDVELWGDYNRRNLLWESFIEMSAGYFVCEREDSPPRQHPARIPYVDISHTRSLTPA